MRKTELSSFLVYFVCIRIITEIMRLLELRGPGAGAPPAPWLIRHYLHENTWVDNITCEQDVQNSPSVYTKNNINILTLCCLRPVFSRIIICAFKILLLAFYRTKQLCQRGFSDRISVCLTVRPSVFPSICLSLTRVLCNEEKEHTADILTIRKGNHSSFLTPTEVGGRSPLPSEIWA